MPAKTLLVIGTGSDSGKSIITGAICRYLNNVGVRVAPFKPVLVCSDTTLFNDMHSDTRFEFVAVAARLELSRKLNPIQLTPLKQDWLGRIISPATMHLPSGRTLEVPMLGKDAPFYPALDADARKEIRRALSASMEQLAAEFDVIIAEGAGNPTDLGDDDLPYRILASRLNPTSILVSKISSGGMAASLQGTCALLAAGIKERLRGFVINDVIGCDSHVGQLATELEQQLGVACVAKFPNLRSMLPYKSREQELEGLAELVGRCFQPSLLNDLQ